MSYLRDVYPNEARALLDMYVNTNGDAWLLNTNWDAAVLRDVAEGRRESSAPWCNSWHGIECDRHKRVDYLGLHANQLQGTVGASLCELRELKRLYLWRNRLSGTLPTCLGAQGVQGSLAFVDLHANRFSGSLPRHLLTSSEATHVILEDNDFEGAVPLDASATPGAKLTHLWLGVNPRLVEETLPSSFGAYRAFQRRVRGDEL